MLMNSIFTSLSKFFVAFLTPPPIVILSPTIKFLAILVIFVGLYTAHRKTLFLDLIAKNTCPPLITVGDTATVPVIVPDVYGEKFSKSI